MAQEPAAAKKPVDPNAFLRIGKDGTCTVFVKHLEFGQGVTTSLEPRALADDGTFALPEIVLTDPAHYLSQLPKRTVAESEWLQD